MSQLKVNTIRHTSASSDAITLASDGTATAKITNNLSNRNLIINGAMQVAQRGTSSTSSNGYYTVDRIWHYYQDTDEAPTFSQVDVASGTPAFQAGFRKAFKVTNGNQTSGAGASDQIQLEYRVEAQDIACSGWNYLSSSSFLTLSFYIKSSVAQAFNFFVQTSDGTSKHMPFSTPSLTADTWTKVSFQIKGDSNLQFNNDNGKGLMINLSPFLGTNYTDNSITNGEWITYASGTRYRDATTTWYTTNDATWEITGLQLEVGDTATDYEHRSYGDELARSQRYYQGFTAEFREDDSSDGSIFFGTLGLPVKMRSAPTITSSYASSYNVNTGASLEDSHIDPQAICFGHRSSGAGTRARRTIGLSSEL